MGFSIETSVPILTVFIQGLLSFLSPCVLPLLPLYVSYLAGGAKVIDDDGGIHYPRRKVLVNTIFFVIGISFAFFALGFGFTALGQFFSGSRLWFARISGIIMIMFGLYQFGVFGESDVLGKERRFLFRLDRFAMGPIPALLLGFTFSFAWTPCIGPILGSVLLMAGSSDLSSMGFMLIGVYTLGFVLPFLAVGFFTGSVLEFFKNHRNVVKYTVKAGAVLLILMGIMTFTGFLNGFTGYLSRTGGVNQGTTQVSPPPDVSEDLDVSPEVTEDERKNDQVEEPSIPAPDFTLMDQYGNEHTLSDYKGKTIFINFWATWCPPCRGEMPDIQALYERYGSNQEDLIVLGVAGPSQGREGNVEHITKFLADNSYTFPVVMDKTGSLFSDYGINAFPTTFMIDKEGNVFGYATSALSADIMESIVQQTMTGKRTS
ncbi:redoxin family protein [Anaerotignum sp.]|uniref:redoxin family protein n=1 Tax=Anaerotignum sp. TaxID=2039241 RepID=UPI0028AEF736|nr:cytochrome c biogenesis protein CcdA [Anaerotignum sp.]